MKKVWFVQHYRELAEMVLQNLISEERAKEIMKQVTPYSVDSELEYYRTMLKHSKKAQQNISCK